MTAMPSAPTIADADRSGGRMCIHSRGVVVKITSGQSVALDLARGISAQAVLLGHDLSAVGYQHPKLLFQNLGVVVFFILSGMLVTRSVMNKPDGYRFADYLIDRGARIFVPYVPAHRFHRCNGLAAQS